MQAGMEQVAPDQHEGLTSGTNGPAAKSLRWYLLWLFTPTVVVFVITYAAILIPALGFDRWGQSKWGPILEYGYSARDVNADVVIFGDSSAFLGVDPRQVNQSLGIRSAVIPNTVRAMPVIEDAPLRAYLAHNRAPKILVLYFTAWDMDGAHNRAEQGWYEGEEMLLRHGTAAEVLGFTLRHPMEMLLFPLRLNSTLGLANVKRSIRTSRYQEVADGLGHVDYTDPFPPEPADCALTPDQASVQPDTWAQQLRAKYSTAQTRVLIYLAPIPNCIHAHQVASRSYAAEGAEPPHILPQGWFAGDGLNAHPRPEHVQDTTELFIKFLSSHLER